MRHRELTVHVCTLWKSSKIAADNTILFVKPAGGKARHSCYYFAKVYVRVCLHPFGFVWAITPAFMHIFQNNLTAVVLEEEGDGRVVQWCWVNFQCRGVLQFGYSRARACAHSRCGWVLFGHFYSPLSFLSSLSLSLEDGSI